MLMRTRAGLLGCLTALALAAAPRVAHAGACCGTGFGLGLRLAPAEKASVLVSVRTTLFPARWNADGMPALNRSPSLENRLEVGGMVRFNSAIQLGASLPYVVTHKDLLKGASMGGGAGDARLSGRYDLVPPGGEDGLPGIAFTLGGTLPTGRSPASGEMANGADVTGQGLYELRPGLVLEKTWLNGWMVMGGASVSLVLPRKDQSGRDVWNQPRLQLFVAGGPTFFHTLSVAPGLVMERENAPLVGGVALKRAAREKTAATITVAWEMTDNWNLIGQGQAELPLPLLGRNEDVGITAVMAIRYVVVAWDG